MQYSTDYQLEALEFRLLLNGDLAVPLTETDPQTAGAMASPVSAAVVAEFTENSTVVQLLGGETLTLAINPKELVDGLDLAGVSFTLAPGIQAPFQIHTGGKIAKGAYKDGNFNFLTEGILLKPFTYAANEVTARFSQGAAKIAVRDNAVKSVGFEVEGEVDVQWLESDTLRLAGTISGKYENDSIDIDGTLNLRETFDYSRDTVTARLHSGSVSVRIEQGSLRSAVLTARGDLYVQTASGSALQLAGALQGLYQKYSLDFEGILELVAPFKFQQDAVSATLNSGTVSVQVRDNRLSRAVIAALGELEIASQHATPLRLGGTVAGTYENDALDLDCNLAILQDFTCAKAGTKCTLFAGSIVTVTGNTRGHVQTRLEDVGVRIQHTWRSRPWLLEGKITSGRIIDGALDFRASLSLAEPLLYTTMPVNVYLLQADVHVVVTDCEIRALSLKRPVFTPPVLSPPDNGRNLQPPAG